MYEYYVNSERLVILSFELPAPVSTPPPFHSMYVIQKDVDWKYFTTRLFVIVILGEIVRWEQKKN